LDKISAKELVAIVSRLRPLAEEGNKFAALLLEYCTCYVSSPCPFMRFIEYRRNDRTYMVKTKSLPYLVTLRMLSGGETLVCQRRATGTTAYKITEFLSPLSERSPSHEPPFSVDCGNEGSSAGVQAEHEKRILRNVLDITTTVWPTAFTPNSRDLLHPEVSDNSEHHPEGSRGRSSCGMVECLGAGGANEVVEIDVDMRETIDILDHTVPDTIHQIGVVLVPKNVNNVSDILGREWDGRHWYWFLERLGSFVTFDDDGEKGGNGEGGMTRAAIHTSARYCGGLNPTADGSQYLYYAERARQVVFHVPSVIPDGPDVGRRRISNLLNCKVVVVWNESGCRFDPATFSTQLAFVQIIISPTKDYSPTSAEPKPLEPSDLFRVRVFSDQTAAHFGPLRPNMEGYLIPWAKLSDLVRLTAIHADIAENATADKYVREGARCEERADAILRIVERSSPSARSC
jgi:Rap/ran-GAP